jgi:hypothetical protein
MSESFWYERHPVLCLAITRLRFREIGGEDLADCEVISGGYVSFQSLQRHGISAPIPVNAKPYL